MAKIYKIIVPIYFLFFIPILLQSKESQKNIRQANFSNEELLNPLFKKLHELETKHQGKVNIVHIGDSHIQADFFTNVIRQNMQTKFGNGGYGFTFPYKLAKTNSNTYITYTSDIDWNSRRNIYPITDIEIGISGIGFYTHQRIFRLTLKSSPLYLFNRVKILYPTQKPMFKLSEEVNSIISLNVLPTNRKETKSITHRVKSGETLYKLAQKYNVSITALKKENRIKSDKLKIGTILKINKPTKIREDETIISSQDYSVLNKIAYVDSNKTKALPYMSIFNLSQSTNQISIYPDTSNSSQNYTLNGIVLENDNPGVVYNAIGVNGATVSDYNKYPLFFQQLTALEPNLIIVSLGTNESFGKWSTPYFRTEIMSFINQVKKYNPQAIILLMSPPPSLFKRRFVNNFIEEYANVLKNIDGCVYWDFLNKQGGVNAPLRYDFQNYMAKDKIHYTKEGYQMQGELFCKDFISAYNNFIKKDTIESTIELH